MKKDVSKELAQDLYDAVIIAEHFRFREYLETPSQDVLKNDQLGRAARAFGKLGRDDQIALLELLTWARIDVASSVIGIFTDSADIGDIELQTKTKSRFQHVDNVLDEFLVIAHENPEQNARLKT